MRCSPAVIDFIMMAVDDMRPVYSHRSMVFIKQELPTSSESRSKTIHSGHFMVSRVHDANNDDDEEEPSSPFSDDSKGFDFFTASKETSTTYNFSHTDNQAVGIDASLTKLFECMTLAYRCDKFKLLYDISYRKLI